MRRRGRSRVRDTVQIMAPDVDAERVFRTIEADLAREHLHRVNFYVPSYDDLLDPVEQHAKPHTELEYYLQRLRSIDVTVTPHVIPSRVPLIGPLVDSVKRQFHYLVLYYVNILAGKQSQHNAQMFRILITLTRQLQSLLSEQGKEAEQKNSLAAKNGKR